MPLDERAARPHARRTPKKDKVPPAASITLRPPGKGKPRRITVGFAWDLFLLSGITFGLPLFLRRLPQWGAAVLALWVANLLLRRGAGAELWHDEVFLFAGFLLLQLWLGFKGNALTARAYRALGWTVEDARDPGVRQVLALWRIER